MNARSTPYQRPQLSVACFESSARKFAAGRNFGWRKKNADDGDLLLTDDTTQLDIVTGSSVDRIW